MKKILVTLLILIIAQSGIKAQKFFREISDEYSVLKCEACPLKRGVVDFEITIFSHREVGSLNEAKRASVKAVLLDGISGTAVSSPIIKYSVYEAHKQKIDDFIMSSHAESFVTSAKINPMKSIKLKGGVLGKGYQSGINVSVAYENLEKYVNQNLLK